MRKARPSRAGWAWSISPPMALPLLQLQRVLRAHPGPGPPWIAVQAHDGAAVRGRCPLPAQRLQGHGFGGGLPAHPPEPARARSPGRQQGVQHPGRGSPFPWLRAGGAKLHRPQCEHHCRLCLHGCAHHAGKPLQPDELGKRSIGVPYNQISLWGDYSFGDFGLAGLKVGMGARYLGQTRGLAYGVPSRCRRSPWWMPWSATPPDPGASP